MAPTFVFSAPKKANRHPWKSQETTKRSFFTSGGSHFSASCEESLFLSNFRVQYRPPKCFLDAGEEGGTRSGPAPRNTAQSDAEHYNTIQRNKISHPLKTSKISGKRVKAKGGLI